MRYDQYAEMEPCLLRPGKVRSSRTGAFVEPVFVRYREPKIHLDFRDDIGFTKRQIYAFLEA